MLLLGVLLLEIACTDLLHLLRKLCLVWYVTGRLVCQLIFDISPYLLASQHLLFFFLASIGVSLGLQPIMPVSVNRSRVYFCCETLIPFFDLTTSIHRKYQIFLKSFTSNSVARTFFNLPISLMLSPMRIMSFTYTIRIIFFPFLCLKNIVSSNCPWHYPSPFITFVNLLNHALEDYLSPYKNLFSLQTLFSSPLLLNP